MLQRQRLFVKHYVRTGNGAEAARLAGYAPNCARQTAHRLLNTDHVQQAVNQEQWSVDEAQWSTKNKATNMLILAFHQAKTSTEMRKTVDALCKLHGLGSGR